MPGGLSADCKNTSGNLEKNSLSAKLALSGYMVLSNKSSCLRHSGGSVLIFINQMPTLRIHSV